MELIQLQKKMHEDLSVKDEEIRKREGIIKEREEENRKLRAEIEKMKAKKQKACCTVF